MNTKPFDSMDDMTRAINQKITDKHVTYDNWQHCMNRMVLPWVDLIESLSNNNKGIADFNKAFKNLT
jgi:hypothetical protein